MTDFVWTDERINQLRAMFADKHSASEIAASFGLTRNAICGKLSRLGLTRGMARAHPNPTIEKPRRIPKHEATGAPVGSLAFKVINAIKRKQKLAETPASDPEPFVCGTADVEPLNISLGQLTETTCRYPSPKPPFTYCGQSIHKGPYCAQHHRLCYVGVPERRATIVNPAELGRSRAGVFGRVA